MSRTPAWARWRPEYLNFEAHHASIVTSQGEHPGIFIIKPPSLFVINPSTQQPVFVVDLARCTCNVSGTTETILFVKLVHSLATHPTFMENGRIRIRSKSQPHRDHLASAINSSLKRSNVGMQLQGTTGESTTEQGGSTRVPHVAIDTLTVRRLATTASQVREICDRIGLFDKVLTQDLNIAHKLVATERKLLLGLKATLLAPSPEDGECIMQLRLITQSVLGRALPWMEYGETLLQTAMQANDYSAATMRVVERHLNRVSFFSEILAWVTHAHVIFTQPSTSQEAAEIALRLSQVFHILAERPRTQPQLTTLVARLTWATKDILGMVNVAHVGREVEGELRDAILSAVQAGMAVQDALYKFMLSPPFPFEFDVVVAHCYRLGAALLEILHAAAASGEWEFLDFGLAMHVDWARLDPATPYVSQVARQHSQHQQQQRQHATLRRDGRGAAVAAGAHTPAARALGQQHLHPQGQQQQQQQQGAGQTATMMSGASIGSGYFEQEEEDGDANVAGLKELSLLEEEEDDDDDYEDEAQLSKLLTSGVEVDALDQAVMSNERYRDIVSKQLDEAKQRCDKAVDAANNVSRLCLLDVLRKLMSASNKLICVDSRNASSVDTWSKTVSSFVQRIQTMTEEARRVFRAQPRGASLTGDAATSLLTSIKGTVAIGTRLLADLDAILKSQTAAQARRDSDARKHPPKPAAAPASPPSAAVMAEPGYMSMRMGMGLEGEEDEYVYTDITAPAARVQEAVSEDEDEDGGAVGQGERKRAGSVFDGGEEDVIYLTKDSLKEQQKKEMAADATRVLAAASLPQIVTRITRSERFDPKLMSAVILTYHSFTTGRELLDLLITRFEESLEGKVVTTPAEDPVGFQVRARVLNAIKRWLIDNADDFRDRELLSQLRSFLQRHQGLHSSTKNMLEMVKHIESCRRQSTANIFTDSGARRILGDMDEDEAEEWDVVMRPRSSMSVCKLDLCQLGYWETAEQLTLWHWKLYVQLTPHDLIGKKAEKAPRKKLLAKHATVVTFWVMASILREAERLKRVQRLKYMVRLADTLLSLGNFDLFYAVYLGISHSSIRRLKQTWKLFRDKHPRSTTLYEKHEQLCGDLHFGRLRALLRERHLQAKPCIPPIPMYNNDFLRRQNAFNDTMDNNGVKLINLMKRMNLVEAIEEIRAYQRLEYRLPAKEIIQMYLDTQFVKQVSLSSLEASDRSRQIEPPSS
ncbi:hypothetical protein PTSG_12101 [Salpingoeca rosetta]|uniref:Ras-GEF domain-containing protein n=1 Tax=Salpingoeca rosetta (strain ATCC 50818 / BSB-021) TaxID=946362 RepID=F2U7B3_SALR5|nr:uncharacterized protein PTSG_12101 [Salpingoeca rosetta]EGD83330.1 hypothetical protein PTSG_12101 [Salpingoeca rosetta]|eukprot:XP_004994834.1 hypothetical protein PTSG_12101 [Salpingoeca rosetta]